MKGVEEVIRYGSLKEGKIYRRDLLEDYIEKYRCMLIEAGAKRGILSSECTDSFKIKSIIENANSNFRVGRTIVSNKFFGEVIIVEKVSNI
ncbi:hypothetical protein [Clostridium sp. D53t1_180928_C8]|uniref:hypothetical protein n=1 Tax=Clostridium sp. D53t1_180928_C8 TaxID=2787101 RepID=UPI0018AA66A2|nr:hypothetical protein [Clostridium sp. D53t1_180928_C8]